MDASSDTPWSYNKYYYEKNKQRLKEKIKCPCGSSVARYNLNHHHTSKKHLAFVKSEVESLREQLRDAHTTIKSLQA